MDFDLYGSAAPLTIKHPPLPHFGDLGWSRQPDRTYRAKSTSRSIALVRANVDLLATIGLTIVYQSGWARYDFKPGATRQQIDDVLGEAKRRLRELQRRHTFDPQGPVRSVAFDTECVTAHLDHASGVFTCPINVDKRRSPYIARQTMETWAVLKDEVVIVEAPSKDGLKSKLRAYLRGLTP